MRMKKQTKRFIAGGMLALTMFPVYAQKENALTLEEKKEGWVLLFDGNTTRGWETPAAKPVTSGWEVKNGVLTALKEGKGGDIVSQDEYSDFDLMMDYNLEAEGNSGVKYFYTRYEKGGNLGIEYQILDDKSAEDNKKANHLTGSFYDVLPPDESVKKVNAPGQWNTLRIVSKHKKVEHWINGVKILEYVRGSKEVAEAVVSSKFNATQPAFGTVQKGHILLQEHGAQVSFKNIKIRKL
jgi:hypothetical protein